MSVRVAHIQKAVETALAKRFPEQMKHCYVDVTFQECSSSHCMFLAHVCVRDMAGFEALHEMEPDGSDHVLSAFNYYQGAEDDDDSFIVDSTQFLIGDGDDMGAVAEVGPWQVDIWVRWLR